MELLIITVFILTILITVVYYLIKYGFAKETLKKIGNKIFYFRGLFFLIFWIYCCFKIMNMVNGYEKMALLPFVFCGLGGVLLMYPKTRKIGYKLFMISFFGGFGILMIIGLIASH